MQSNQDTTQDLRKCTVAIQRSSDSKVLGTGVIVTDYGLIVTCYHVIGNLKSKTIDFKDVDIYFPSIPDIKAHANVLEKYCDASSDIAFLQLQGKLPAQVAVANISESIGEDHEFKSFGFKQAGKFEGLYAGGKIRGTTNLVTNEEGKQSHLLIQLYSGDRDIGHGMSGAPVLDKKINRVIGIVSDSWIEKGTNTRLAFAIPVQSIIEVYPELKQKIDEQQYSFIRKWGSFGTDNGELNYPQGITVDSLNNVYVTDSSNNRIQKFDSNGTFITKWGSPGTGNGEFNSPVGVSVDHGTGEVYVTDDKNNRIQKFDSNGTFITKWGSFGTGNGEFNSPVGVSVDHGTGEVYVVDIANNCIQKFDSNGTFITKWGSPGTGNGKMNRPAGVAIDSSGNVYITETGNYRIQKFDSNGTFITKWGSFGTGNGEFNYPIDVAVDYEDNVYVVDCNNNRIQKFDSNGTFITKWGSFGTGNGEFNFAEAIAIDPGTGYLFILDYNNSSIQVFAPRNTSLLINVESRSIEEEEYDIEELELITYNLRDDLIELDVVKKVDAVRKEDASPKGSKAGGDAVIPGSLLVTLRTSAAARSSVISNLTASLQSWLTHHERYKISLEIEGDKLEVTCVSDKEQQRLIEIWISRHLK